MEETLSVSEFKARCLDLLKRIGKHQLARVTVTRHGQTVAIITPPPGRAESIRALHGFLKDRTLVPDDLDLTAPTSSDEEFDAARGRV